MTNARFARVAPEDLLLLGAIVGLPWFYGGATLGAHRAAAFLVVLAATVWAFRRGLPAGPPRAGFWAAGAACCVFAFVQVAPLPPGVVAAISPAAHRLAHTVLPPDAAPGSLTAAAERRLPAEATSSPQAAAPRPSPAPWPAWTTLSLAPRATADSAFWWSALLLAALLVSDRVAHPARRELYRGACFALVGSVAAFGLVQAAAWNGKMFWLWPQEGRPFGPYVNSNHFAGLMELGLPWIAGYLAMRFRRKGWDGIRAGGGPWAAASLALGLAGVVVCKSRTGALLTFAAVTAVILLVSKGNARRWAAAAVAASWGAVAGLMAFTPAGERFRDAIAASGALFEPERAAGWAACVPMLRDFPWVGSGVGSFRWVFPHYLPAGESKAWLQAHSDWLELALDGGLVLVVLVSWLVVGMGRAAWRNWREPAHRGDRELQTGLLSGLAALSLHALVDFNHQIPGNALAFTVAAAMAATREGDTRGGSG